MPAPLMLQFTIPSIMPSKSISPAIRSNLGLSTLRLLESVESLVSFARAYPDRSILL